ncbi:MAG: octanoyltransferase [Chloroflexi bacterium]|nr:MAG: octanoyltransferase [Chloroflexota bacterium]RLC87573.1 MAG: octanoyltransferase [Chloroflexota bacterium]
MALDEAILRAVAAGRVLPTLRLYAWEPACLSLGRAQSIADVDADALRAAGLGLVRRSTGGKAILHADELTYSVVAPEAEPRVAGSIVESYRRLSAGLVRGLEQLGAAGVAADQRWGGRRLEGPVCFETPSDYEVTFDGRKLVGSAQMRSLGVVLQHGALPLCGDVARICRFLIPRADPARVRARAITIEQVLGRQAAWSEAAAAFATGFAESLNLHLKPGALTKDEVAWAEELRVKKYATHEWTYKV